MNSLLCKKCRGNVIPTDPLKNRNWKCEHCTSLVPAEEIGKTFSLIGSILRGFDDTDFKLMNKFVTSTLATLVPQNNETVIELKYRMVWILGYKPGYTWQGNKTMQVTYFSKETLCLGKFFLF